MSKFQMTIQFQSFNAEYQNYDSCDFLKIVESDYKKHAFSDHL